MSMVVRTNTMAMSANSALNKNNSTVAGNLQKLSTGFRINRAADDASGLAVSEKMKAQIKALDTASKNAQDGASLIKTAEGYMGEVHDMLNRIVELAEKSANGTFETKDGEKFGDAATDRKAIQDEVNQLTSEIDRIATTANFNNLKLMDGTLSTSGATTPPPSEAKVFQASDLGEGLWKKTGSGNTESDYTQVQVGDAFDANATYATKSGGTPAVYESGDGTEYTSKPSDWDTDGVVYATRSGEAGSYTYTQVNDEAYEDGTYWKQTAAAVPATFTPKNDAAATGTPEASGSGEGTEESGAASGATASKGLVLQIGETSTKADKLTVNVMSFKTDSLFADISSYKNGDGDQFTITQAKANDANSAGLTIDVSSQSNASAAAEAVRKVINSVSAQRAELGAMENRLDYTMNNLDTASQNISDANSRIRDTDMAKTMMEYTQGNTLTQAAQAMLAQANQAPSQVLQLLQ